MRYLSFVFILLATACTRSPELALNTQPVAMPQPLRLFPLKPMEFHDCRIVMFRDGDSAVRAANMQALIANSLKVYEMELAAASRGREQATIKRSYLERIHTSVHSEDLKAKLIELVDSANIEASTLIVYVSSETAGQPPVAMDLWSFIKSFHESKAAGNEAEHARLARSLTDRAVVDAVADAEERNKSANQLLLTLAGDGLLNAWLQWSELRWKNTILDGSYLAAIDAATFYYNYQRTDIRISVGIDANEQPWIHIDDWMLNAIPEIALRDSKDEGAKEETFRFASKNSPTPEDRMQTIRDISYTPEGGMLSFALTTPQANEFRFKVWRSKYDAPDSRTYLFGEVERIALDKTVRRGTVRWIDQTLTELLTVSDESAAH